MVSAPSTPRTPKSKASKRVGASPMKKTILNFDSNETYIEEDDETYINQSSMISEISEISESGDADDLDNENLSNLLEEDEEEEEEEEDVKESPKKSAVSPEEPKSGKDPKLELFFSELSGIKKFIVKHEVPRKLLHSSIGIFTLWLYTLGVHQTQLILPLSTMFVVIFTNDYIRFKNPELNRKIVTAFWWLIREKEIDKYNGTLWYLSGLIIVFAVLPKDISLMSVLLLSWADTSASTIGRQFGRYTPKLSEGKSLAGSLASFVTGIFSCYLIYGYFIPNYDVNTAQDILWTPSTSNLNIHVYALLSGLIASVSEFIDLWGIDDNFTIPVLSGYFLYAVVKATNI